MIQFSRRGRLMAVASVMAASLAMASSAAQAAPSITVVNADLSSAPYSFSYLGGMFTFAASGDFFSPLAVQTAGSAAFRTVFGNPSPDFIDRGGPVVYDASTLGGFGPVPNLTTVSYSNGNNFLGLRVTQGGQDYYGFAFTENSVLHSYGFESTPNTGITAVAAGVPEPAAWALMVLGFGAIGVAMRRRQTLSLRYT